MSLLLRLVAPVDDTDASPSDIVQRSVSTRPCGAAQHHHSDGCGHVAITHDDHIDYLVGTELHHHKDDGTCDVHGQLLPEIQASPFTLGTPSLRRRTAVGVGIPPPPAANLSAPNVAPHSGLHGWRFAVGFALSFAFMCVEFGVGHVIGSLALQADAFHMASDVAAMGIGWYADRAARRTRTARATYGFRRIEIVGALVNCVFLLSISFTILIEALQRLAEYEAIAEALSAEVNVLMIVGAVGLAVNILALGVFGLGHGHAHSHGGGHGHSHGEEQHAHGGGSGISLNVQGVLAHIIGDALGSVAVIVSGIAVRFSTSPYRGLADPLTSLGIIALLVMGTLSPLKQAIAILAQTVPSSIDTDALCRDMLAVKDVVAVHDLHAWQLDQKKVIGSVHVLVRRDARSFYSVVDAIKSIMHRAGIHSSTVQVEFDMPRVAMAGDWSPTGRTCHDVVCGPTCEEAQCCPASPVVAAVAAPPQEEEAHGHARVDGAHGHSHGAAAATHEHGHEGGEHGHEHAHSHGEP